MNSRVNVNHTKEFLKDLKRLLKKYPSLLSDLEKLDTELTENPRKGTPLGYNIYKIRLAVKSKGKGKSGGARIISFLETEIIATIENTVVNLVAIYDKSEVASVSLEKIKDRIKNI